MATALARPFTIDVPYADPFRRTVFSALANSLERTLGLTALNDIYADVSATHDHRDFLQKALDALHTTYHVSPSDLARIPRTGPLIVVSNHPFGGLDGIILAALLRSVRPDVKVMANYLLARIPDLHDFMIFVDPFATKDSARKNIRALRSAIDHVSAGGLLTIFPAGEVSHLDWQKRTIIDPAWSDTVARIVRKTNAPVLPVFFGGSNSPLFQLLGMVHPLLRTAMLPRELLNKKTKSVAVQIGNPITTKKLQSFTNDEDLTAYLRLRCYVLQAREAEKPRWRPAQLTPKPIAPQTFEPIAPPVPANLLAAEIAALPPAALLLEHNEMTVYAAYAPQLPHLLNEIGRLREITFRGVSEGTGKASDLDRFDAYYVHLFIWNREKSEVVGAYRLGTSQDILPRYGAAGFYTSTLFNYQQKVLEQVGPAMELGRSFVRPEYQKSYSPLLLLWKGIGAFVVRHPQYQVLFGPVSINNQYNSLSRQLIMTFLEANSGLPDLARRIKAKNPPPPPRTRPSRNIDLKNSSLVVRDIDEVSDLVSEIESDQKGIPILLKQYLKLGGKFLGFNIDPDFGDVLDGLILVDLANADPHIVERFTTIPGAKILADYRANHPKKNQ